LSQNPPFDGESPDPKNTVEAWKAREQLAQSYVAITERLKKGDVGKARSLIDGLSVDPNLGNASLVVRLKAQAMSAAGDGKQAYSMLLEWAFKEPVAENVETLRDVGKQLGKTNEAIDNDLTKLRVDQSKPPPPMELRDFATDKKVSLSDYRGKVILISFWYPKCGPRRAEFPHMDTVIRGLQNPDIVYLAPNGYPEEDGLVDSFVKSMGYAFTPLKVNSKDEIMDAKGVGIQSFPTNFLIDRAGRVAYRVFVVENVEAESVLKARIEALLRDKVSL